jgi:hypothetical protein
MSFENILNPLISSKSNAPNLPLVNSTQGVGQRSLKLRPDARILSNVTTYAGGVDFSIVADGQNGNTRFHLMIRDESGKAQYINLGSEKDKARSLAQALLQNGIVSKAEAVRGNFLALMSFGESSATDTAAEEMKARAADILAEALASNAEQIERFFFELSGSSPSDKNADQIRQDELKKAQMKIAIESISLRIQRCCDGLITKSQALAGLPECLANRVASLIDSTMAAASEGSERQSGAINHGEKRFALLLDPTGNNNILNVQQISATA